jgi:hypothetical protein
VDGAVLMSLMVQMGMVGCLDAGEEQQQRRCAGNHVESHPDDVFALSLPYEGDVGKVADGSVLDLHTAETKD